MPITFRVATTCDVAGIVALRTAATQKLTSEFGKGYWSGGVTEKGVLFTMRTAKVYVAKDRKKLIATMTLSTTKPWAIDKSYFSACKCPLYLTAMVVHPNRQRTGVGRQCIDEAREIAKRWPCDAIRLDAFDAEAGAGDFYRKCGFREVGRASYRNTPLIYFEMLVTESE